MSHLKSAAIIILSVLFIPGACSATQVGAFDLKVLGSVYETYDDNITYAQTNIKDDWITNAKIGLLAKYEGKTESLEFLGNVVHHDYMDNSNFNNTSEDLSLSAKKEFSPYERAILSDTFTHAEEPSSFEDEFGRTSGRYSYYRNRFNIAFSKDLSKEFTLIGRYLNDYDAYSGSGHSDSFQNRIGFEGDYIISSHTTVFGAYDFYQREFDPGSSATTNSLSVGARQYFSSQLFLDANTGVDFIKSYNNKDYTKPHFTASLTDDFDETTRLTLAYDKRYYTNSSTQDLFNYWQTSLKFTRRVSARLGASASGFYGKGTYEAFNITDTLKGASAGLSYDIKENIKGTLSYSYSKTTSNIASRGYDRNVVSTGVTVEF
ncbi:MAG: outer membrane beta-barrel protein [Candidatus Omnitrophota bacterium]